MSFFSVVSLEPQFAALNRWTWQFLKTSFYEVVSLCVYDVVKCLIMTLLQIY